jgi:hypothetical protein
MEKVYYNFKYNTSGRKVDTIWVSRRYCDGPSLFYYARANASRARSVYLPTFIDGIKGMTLINFNRRRTSVRISSVNYPIDVYELDGEVTYTGFFGLTGKFKGWITTDRLAVPVKGKLSVFLGSIVVELKSWNGRWNPPRAVEN